MQEAGNDAAIETAAMAARTGVHRGGVAGCDVVGVWRGGAEKRLRRHANGAEQFIDQNIPVRWQEQVHPHHCQPHTGLRGATKRGWLLCGLCFLRYRDVG